MRVGAAVKSRPLSAERVGSAEPSCAPLPTGAADAVVRAAVGSLEGASLRSASTVGVAVGVVIVGTPVIGVAVVGISVVGTPVIGVAVVGVAVVLSPDCSVYGKQTDRGTHS